MRARTDRPAPRRHDLAALDGLRAIAIGLVLAHHFALVQAPNRWTGRVEHVLLGAGRLGVVLFFVVSGLVIWRPVARAIADGEALPAAGSFVVRRAVRVLPAYWLAVVLQSWWVDESRLEGVREWVTHLGLAQNLRHGAIFRGTLVGWTLSIELSFYAMVALVLLVGSRLGPQRRRRWEPRLLGALLVLPWILRLGYVRYAADDVAIVGDWFAAPAWTLSFAWWADAFGLGMVIATATARWTWRVAGRTATLAALGAAVVVLAVEATGRFVLRPGRPASTALLGEVPVRAVPAVVVVAAVVLAPRSLAARALSARWLRSIGVVSFGVYLWHLAVIRTVRDVDWLPDVLAIRLGLDVVAALVIGALSWYVVERPLIDAVRRRQGAVASEPTPAGSPAR